MPSFHLTKRLPSLLFAIALVAAWLPVPFLSADEPTASSDEFIVFKVSLTGFDNGLCLLRWQAGNTKYQALSNMREELAAMIMVFELDGKQCELWIGRGPIVEWTSFWGDHAPSLDLKEFPPQGNPAQFILIEPSGDKTSADMAEICKLESLHSFYNANRIKLENDFNAQKEANRLRKLLPPPPKPVDRPRFRRINRAALIPGALPDYQFANNFRKPLAA